MKTSCMGRLPLCGGVLLVTAASWGAEAGLDAPMDRELVSVLIRIGLKDSEPTTREGTYRLSKGRIVATDGWRFVGDDYATLDKFQMSSRRLVPRFFQRRGGNESALPVEPNGFVVTLAGLDLSSVLEVSTSGGEFKVPVGELGYGDSQPRMAGNADYRRIPTSRQIIKSPTEDAYPSAVLGPDGRLCVAYIAFRHGVGFEDRLPIATDPQDYAYLGKPTGGDQLMFTELRDGAWTAPVPLTEEGGDLFGTALALDGQGRLWVFWAANVNENWDLFGAVRGDSGWSGAIRISNAPGSDFHPVAATDAEGRVWVAWQSFNSTQSDILVARQEGNALGAPAIVAGGPSNEWEPAIATATGGQIAVAWDTYERGNYDVALKTWQSGNWSDSRVIAATLQNEVRASLAYDAGNRLWISYEISPEGWGKDFGPYDEGPQRLPLYREREVGVQVLADGVLSTPQADAGEALPMPGGQRRRRAAARLLAAGPQVTIDKSGRVWLAARIRANQFDSSTGGTWLTYLTTLDGDAWRTAVMVPESDGFLCERSVLVPAPDSGLYVISASDGRFRNAAAFGQPPRLVNRRDATLPPPSTRQYGAYADTEFNKEIAVADTGRVEKPGGPCQFAEAAPVAPAEPADDSRTEARQIADIRGYRADIGGKTLRIVRGEFHRHTEISPDGGGDGSLFDMWRYGLDMAALDWIGNGDHDNGNGREFSWWMIQKTTSLFHVPGSFSPMFTYERSVNYPDGHRNAVFARRGVRPLNRLQGGQGKSMDDQPPEAPRPNSPDTQMFYKYLRFFDGVCASHTSGTDMGTDWRDNDPLVEPVVEIYQGDRQSYERPGAPRTNSDQYSIGGWRPYGFVSLALLKGYRLGFQSSSDHISTHMSYCNVWVEEPSREAILEGLKLRRVYGATDNIIADVRCGEHFMGEEFRTPERPTLRVKLIGTAPFAEVVIVKDNEYVYTTNPNTPVVEFQWTDHAAQAGKTSYYYVRGLQRGETQTKRVASPQGGQVDMDLNDGEMVWVSPMWITYQP